MSFDMTRLRRFNPDEELTQQEIKDLKDGVPNYPMPESEGPEYPHEWLCGECTGSGIMLGFYPCKVCNGIGFILPKLSEHKKNWNELIANLGGKPLFRLPYPNERELSLLNNRIATLKAQLSKELQKKKSERSQRDINQLQQSINTLTKWKKK